MLNTTVFSLSIFSDQDGVDVVIGCFVAFNASAGTHICEEVEGTTEGKVERDVTLADGGCKRSLESDIVSLDRLDRFVWNDSPAVLQSRSYIDRFPLDRDLGRVVDVFHGLRNLRTNTISFY